MIPNNNLSVLPWYDSIGQQNARKWWVYGRVYPLYVQAGFIPPFQILLPYRPNQNFSACELYDANTNTQVASIITNLRNTGLATKQFMTLGYSVIVYPGQLPALSALNNGRYYMRATINGAYYYSEVFTVVNDIQPYLKIEWWDKEDFVMDAGVIVYETPDFKNVLYLDAEIAKPEYTFEEEGENRDGYFFPSKMISAKRYKFNFFASEYLLDVMRFIRMADYVEITKGTDLYSVGQFLITPTWERNGDVAGVEAEFETATVAKKINLGYQTAEPAELTLTIATNVSSPTIALTVDGSAVPYSAGMVIPAGAAVGVTVSKTGYTSVTDSFAMSAANSSKYYELTQDIPATISYPDEITSAAQSVRFTISDPSGHGWRLDWTSESYYGYITGGAVVSGNATRNGSVISGTGDAVVTLSVAANTNNYGRWVGQNPAPIYFRDNSTGSYEEVNFYQNEGSATIVPVTSVTLNKSSLSLSTGGSERLTATVKPTNATNPALSWTSTNTSVATVSQDGTVHAVAAGTAVIRATATDGSGKYATCSVTVTSSTVPVMGVSVTPSTLNLSVGGSATLVASVSPTNATDKSVTWMSTNPAVATVSSSGVVTATGVGTTNVTVRTNDGNYSATCRVTVTEPTVRVTGVSLNESSLTLTVGESSQLSATVYPANADNKAVSWSSSNPTVASVSSGGLVTAVNGGQAIITVTTADGGYTASCAVTVRTIIHTLTVYDARLETSPTVDFSFMLTNTTLGNTLKGVTIRLRDASKSYDDTLLDYESEKFVGLLQAQGGTFVYTGTITATTAMIQSGVGMRLWVRFRYSGDGEQYTGYSDVAIPQD